MSVNRGCSLWAHCGGERGAEALIRLESLSLSAEMTNWFSSSQGTEEGQAILQQSVPERIAYVGSFLDSKRSSAFWSLCGLLVWPPPAKRVLSSVGPLSTHSRDLLYPLIGMCGAPPRGFLCRCSLKGTSARRSSHCTALPQRGPLPSYEVTHRLFPLGQLGREREGLCAAAIPVLER